MSRSFTPDQTWTSRFCPACSSVASRLSFYKENVPFVECVVCKTVYVTPTPPPDLLSSLYHDLGIDYFTNPTKLASDFNPHRYWRECATIPHWARHGNLLDVGCATGSFLLHALELGFTNVRGIDISAPSIDYANRVVGGNVAICGDFLAQPFQPEEFDLVTLWATLEHVVETEAFIRESWRVLKKQGLLCISVPNRNGLSMRILGPKYHMVGLEHLNYFTPRGLERLLKRNSFVTTRIQTSSFNPISFWKDYQGRHLSGEFGRDDQIADQQSHAVLRKRWVVRLLQRAVELGVIWSETGNLLILTAQKA
ncbi:MAG: class I SAM-dependent methyltransferase [Chloroflexi bacterium]|nr:class I SAM-dependent methyltransferase [Chloroflexota bacterium]MBU1750215.1 class I SAM-dependent methyltransferase [Chloroflexota bacterium]